MKLILSIATICVAAGLTAPAATAQVTPPAAPRPRTVQIVTPALTSYLGINAVDITSERAKALQLKEERGVEITSVDEESAAAKAGLKEGDVVLEYNGQHVEGWEQLRRLVSETPIHREVKIGIWRNGAAQTLTATVGSRKDMINLKGGALVLPDGNDFQFKMPPMPAMPPSIEIPQFRTFAQNRTIGIFGESLGQEEQLAEFFGVKNGILIRSVVKGSAAEKAGIKAGDVLTKIDDAVVASPAEIASALRAAGSKRTFTVTVVRNKKEMVVTVTLESGTSVHGGLWNRDDWFGLQFPAYDRIVQGAEEGAAKIIRQ
ncbi:MAG: PDZ domain-containing protein [Bryobacteraceae bacterium]|jgi:serine protease Do